MLQSLALTAGTFGALALARLGLDLDGASVVTVTFLTLAFAQLWHVFNMRHPQTGLLRNEVTRNPWLWGALVLCTALLAVPPYRGAAGACARTWYRRPPPCGRSCSP